MTLEQQLTSDMLLAMKSRNELKLSVIRMAKTLITNKMKEKKAELTDAEVISILQTMIKQRKDSATQFGQANRILLAEKELKEIVIIETYLPKEASLEEIESTVQSHVSVLESPNVKHMGVIIKVVKSELEAKGLRVDGKILSDVVKSRL